MGYGGLDPSTPPGLDLVSAFLAMEPTVSLVNISKLCGGGRVTEEVQRFIWDHCISQSGSEGGRAVFLTNFVKKIISEVESSGGVVLDELYEQCGYFMALSAKGDGLVRGSGHVCKCISFIFPDGCWELSSCPRSRRLVVPLNCSLNMLEGDTGCSVWPSSLYLSEFILSFPGLFYNQSCFEVGSGVGLVGICLAHVKASKVILTDGNLSTLANLKLNLELNKLSKTEDIQNKDEPDDKAKAEMDVKPQLIPVYLPWESASESELQKFTSDIILGADVIYNPSCLPDLVRVLAILLSPRQQHSSSRKHSSCSGVMANDNGVEEDSHCSGAHMDPVEEQCSHALNGGRGKGPVAYIASVIRNVDTFECFLELSKQSNLSITDVTETSRPFNFLPYMQIYDRNSIRLFRVASK